MAGAARSAVSAPFACCAMGSTCKRIKRTADLDAFRDLCEVVDSASATVEESKRLETPLAVSGGIVCEADVRDGEPHIMYLSHALQGVFGQMRVVSDILPILSKAHTQCSCFKCWQEANCLSQRSTRSMSAW